jgi:hypothetical protein
MNTNWGVKTYVGEEPLRALVDALGAAAAGVDVVVVGSIVDNM